MPLDKKFKVLLGLFGSDKARENFLALCKEYNSERVSQVVSQEDSENYRRKRPVTYSPPKRAALHNSIMETISRLATQTKNLTGEQEAALRDFHSREHVAEAIQAYILAEKGITGGGEIERRDMSDVAYFHSLGKEH